MSHLQPPQLTLQLPLLCPRNPRCGPRHFQTRETRFIRTHSNPLLVGIVLQRTLQRNFLNKRLLPPLPNVNLLLDLARQASLSVRRQTWLCPPSFRELRAMQSLHRLPDKTHLPIPHGVTEEGGPVQSTVLHASQSRPRLPQSRNRRRLLMEALSP